MLNFCSSPFTTVNILGDGRVGLCICNVWHNKQFMGNLFDNSLRDLFSSAWMQEFKDSIYDQSFRYCTDRCSKLHNLDKIENFNDIDRNPVLPTIIYLQDIDRTCNLRCASCRLTTDYSPAINLNAKKILDRLIDDYQGFNQSVMICGDGMGDVFSSAAYLDFMHNPKLPECFKFAFNTNGTLLTKNIDLIKKLRHRFTGVCVSFDASSADTYKDIRGANFNIVLDGVRQVIDLGINVTTSFVLQRKNYKEILEYKELGKSLGVTFIGMEKIKRWGHMTEEWWNENQIDDNSNIDYNFLIPALEEFKAPMVGIGNGVDGTILNLINKFRTTTIV